MDVSGSLSEQLSDLTDALEDPGTDLPAILGVLVDDLTAAIPSFLGLKMTLELDKQEFVLTAIDPADDDSARTSLRLPLDPLTGAGPRSEVIFYATTPGAFVDLAADAQHSWGLDGQVRLDDDLPIGRDEPAGSINDLDRLTEINRAIGVLLDQGYTLERARQQVQPPEKQADE